MVMVHGRGSPRVALGCLLGLALAMTACARAGNQPPPRDPSALGPEVAPGTRVDEVEIAGNEDVSDEAIVEGLATRPPSGLLLKSYTYFDPLQVEEDVDRIEAYYRRQGYYSADVFGVSVRPSGEGGAWVRFLVSEGEPTRVTEISVAGLPEGLRTELARIEREEPDVEPTAPVQRGEVFQHDEYLAAKASLRRWLMARGYAWARVDGEVVVDRDVRTAIVRLYAQPGPLVRFGETTVVGLDRTPESAIRVRLAWDRGEVFDPTLIELTQKRLYELGHFSTVGIDLVGEGRPEVAGVRVRVRESARQELRLGAGVAADNTSRQLRLRIEHRSIGVLDPMLMVQVRVRPAIGASPDFGEWGYGGDAMVQLDREDLGIPRLHGMARVSYRLGTSGAYRLRGPGLRLQVSRPFAMDRLMAGMAWELDRLRFSKVSKAITAHKDKELQEQLGLNEDDPYWLGFFEQTLAYDRRSDVLDPHRGYYLELRMEEGGPFAGGERTYMLGVGEGRGYVPVGDRVVLAGRLRYGRALLGPVPITQRLYSGGASAHRGFTQRSLAPTTGDIKEPEGPAETVVDADKKQVTIGGEELLESNLEVRTDVIRLSGSWLGIALFVDAGDVVLGKDALDLGYLHWAVGAGLRYQTRVGPVRLDVGRRITRTGQSEPAPNDKWAFHLSLGEAF